MFDDVIQGLGRRVFRRVGDGLLYHLQDRFGDVEDTDEDTFQSFTHEPLPEPKVVVYWTGKPNLPKILVLYTGGTLGMKPEINPVTGEEELVPKLSLEELLGKCDNVCNIKERYNILGYHVSHIDSTEINTEVWGNLAKIIHKHHEEYDGVVVLHGTDTLHYTSAALSFALRNISIPVVCTGAQMILEQDGTDVITNMTGALAVAKSDLAETSVLFNGTIYKGTRVVKVHDSWLQGFDSPIYGSIGKHLDYHRELLEQQLKNQNVKP